MAERISSQILRDLFREHCQLETHAIVSAVSNDSVFQSDLQIKVDRLFQSSLEELNKELDTKSAGRIVTTVVQQELEKQAKEYEERARKTLQKKVTELELRHNMHIEKLNQDYKEKLEVLSEVFKEVRHFALLSDNQSLREQVENIFHEEQNAK